MEIQFPGPARAPADLRVRERVLRSRRNWLQRKLRAGLRNTECERSPYLFKDPARVAKALCVPSKVPVLELQLLGM